MASSPDVFLLPADLRGALMQYLGQRPFVEVAGAIASLQQLQKVGVQPQAEKPPSGDDLHPGPTSASRARRE